MMELVKEEMTILEEMEQPGAGVDEYVDALDVILQKKLEITHSLRSKLIAFRKQLDAEESLSASFKKNKKGSKK